MNPVRGSLRYPQVMIALTLVMVGVGGYALVRMPRREDPKINVPIGIVAALYPGATAEEVESQVAHKIEERLFRTEGVRREKTHSTSMKNATFVYVYLEDSVKDTDRFWSKVRLDMAQLKFTDLPEGVLGPVVEYDFGDTVALLLAIHSDRHGYRELKDYAERVEAAIRPVRAASKIKRLGEQKEEIEVKSSLSRLSQYSVDPAQVMKALQARNTVHFAGEVPTERGEPAIQATGSFRTEDEIRNLMVDVSRTTGQPVYIADIANVDRLYKDPTLYSRSNGERAILIAVEMQEGNNIVDFGNDVRGALDRLRPMLPPDLKIDVVADQPKVVEHRVAGFLKEFGISIASVILVTMVLLPLRVAVVSALAIPVTVAATFAWLHAVGIELHQVSIAALVIVLGMVVDDAIVIVDNYIELLDRGVPREEAAWRSATELAVPVLTATLTIIASFLPLSGLSGATGDFIRSAPIAATFALATSFAVAMLLTPVMSRFFIQKGLHSPEAGAKTRRRSPLEIMQSVYNRVVVLAMKRKAAGIAFGGLAIVAGFVVLHYVPEQFFPLADRDQFVISVWLPEGWRVEATDAAVRRIEQVLEDEKEVTSYTSFIGGSAPRFYYNVNPQYPDRNYAELIVSTRSAEVTPGVVEALRPRLERTAPEARVFLRQLQQGPVQEAPIEVRISGDDKAELQNWGGKIAALLQRTPGALDVHSDWRENAYHLQVDLRDELANRLGFTNVSVGQQLAGGFEGLPVTTYWEGNRDVTVALRLEPSRRRSFQDVTDTYVTSPVTGARVPLDSIATVSPVWDSGRIVRRNGVRTLTVRSWASGGTVASNVLAGIKPAADALPLPRGYRIAYGGEYENQNETFPQMFRALVIGVAVIYLILLFQFRSMVDPLIIMIAIPLSLLGAALGLVVTGNYWSFTAYFGIVSLAGIVVRNSIILVDYIRARMAEGVGIEEAAIEAGERRLRPIFLTSMAAAFGVTPMILSGSSLWSPLASTIAFGLIGSMFFTLVVIPVLFVVVHQRRHRPGPIAAGLVLLVACTAAASAQPRTLTLEEAVSLATENNANVKIVGQRVKEMDARVQEARANFFPVLSNSTNAVRIAERQHLDIGKGSWGTYPATGPIPSTDTSIPLGNYNFALSATTLTQPITQYFKIRAGVDLARADAASARADVRRTENEISLKVKELFYAILCTERRRDAVDAQVRAGELRMAEAQDAAESGVVLQLKVAEARAQIAQAKHVRGQLEDTVTNMKLEMSDLLGLPLDTGLELVEPVNSASEPSPDPTGAVEEALAHNPEAEAAGRQLEKAQAALRAARAEYIPEVSLFAQHAYQHGLPFFSQNNGSVGFNLTWTIFEFGKRRGQVNERAAQVAQAEENLSKVRNRVRIDVENAVRTLNRTRTGVSSVKELVDARVEALRITADQVEANTTTTSALVEAEAALLTAQADLLRAEHDHSVAAADLARLTGNH